MNAYEKEYGKEGVMDLAQRQHKHGVQFKTPVFDGAHYDADIKPLLNDLEFATSWCI